MTRSRLSVLTPSRGRPDEVERMARSALDHARGDVEVVVGIDDDDPMAERYVGLPTKHYRCIVFPRGQTVSAIWNRLWEQSPSALYLMGNDDLSFETRGWDEKFRTVSSMYKDGIFCAWGDDGINGERHCAFPCVSRRWTDLLGYFAPEKAGFAFFRNDTWTYDLAHRIGRCHFVGNVKILHRHWTTEGGVSDATTTRNRRGGQSQHDQQVWVDTEGVREQDAAILKEAMDG